MITALISTVLGLVGGLLPDVMKEVRDSRSHVREKELLALQSELQLKAAQLTADSKLREIEAGNFAVEMAATREHLTAIIEAQAKPTGIKWIDGLNASLRPLAVLMILALFMATALPFTWAIFKMQQAGMIDAKQMAEIIWGSLVGESIIGTLGFLFGYRTSMKPAGR